MVSVIATSTEIITNLIVRELAESQTTSLLITLVVATLVLMVSFWFENRQPFLGVITMVPVALVVFWVYGLMYATGIPFGPVTAILSGPADRDRGSTIHIARRFGEDRVRMERLDLALNLSPYGRRAGGVGVQHYGRVRDPDNFQARALLADGTGHGVRHRTVPGVWGGFGGRP